MGDRNYDEILEKMTVELMDLTARSQNLTFDEKIRLEVLEVETAKLIRHIDILKNNLNGNNASDMYPDSSSSTSSSSIPPAHSATSSDPSRSSCQPPRPLSPPPSSSSSSTSPSNQHGSSESSDELIFSFEDNLDID